MLRVYVFFFTLEQSWMKSLTLSKTVFNSTLSSLVIKRISANKSSYIPFAKALEIFWMHFSKFSVNKIWQANFLLSAMLYFAKQDNMFKTMSVLIIADTCLYFLLGSLLVSLDQMKQFLHIVPLYLPKIQHPLKLLHLLWFLLHLNLTTSI